MPSSLHVEAELETFPWDEVTFYLNEQGNFNVDDSVQKAWSKHGFFIFKNLFSENVMKAVEKATKQPIIQDRLQPRTDEDGYKVNFLLWNNLDNGLFGAQARCRKIVGTLESVMGDEIYHYHTKLVLKNGHGGGAFNWHQDYGYWYKNGCLSPNMTTVWLPLDQVDSSNGCLKVIPGSHKLGRIEHIPVYNQVSADPERVKHVIKRHGFVYVEMAIGDGLFFHSNVLHSSEANWSDKRRWAVLYSYNARSNDPVYVHHHPNYYPLTKIENDDVERHMEKGGTDFKFLEEGNDKSLKNGYAEEDEPNVDLK